MTATDGPDPDLLGSETVIRTLRADSGVYWRDTATMAVIAGVAAGAVLFFIGNAYWWIGPVGAVLALGARGAYLASEVMGQVWSLTPTRLIGPGGRVVRLAEVTKVRKLRNDVQLITTAGDKHLLKHLPGADGVVAEIEALRSTGGRRRS